MINAFAFAASQPWVIEPEAYRTVLDVAARLGDPEALATKIGRPMEGARRVELRGDVAVIPIRGPIFRHASLMTDISGATSTGGLATDIQSAIDNTAVRRIVLDIDSPGGEMNGIHELADQIYTARSRKRVDAYVGGLGASAAYWIASAASRIVVSPTALLGSIGVVMTHLDTSERDAKAGVQRTEIVSSGSPFKRGDIHSDDGRARIQAVVDELCDVFVSSVARNRGVTTRKVLESFGRGGLIVGAATVRAGMAEALGSLEDVIADKSLTATGSRTGNASGDLPPTPATEAPHVSSATCSSSKEIFARRRVNTLGESTLVAPSLATAPERSAEHSSDSPNARKVDLATKPDCPSSAEIFARRNGAAPGEHYAPQALSGTSAIFARRAAAVSAHAAPKAKAKPEESTPASDAGSLPSAAAIFSRRASNRGGSPTG